MSIFGDIKDAKKILFADDPVMSDLDDYLLLSALSTKDKIRQLNPEIREYLILTYGADNYERLEYLGDAVLEILVREYLFKQGRLERSRDLSIISSFIVRNTTIGCFMRIMGCKSENLKVCGDLFESLLGAVYIHLRSKHYPYILDWIWDWLNRVFTIKDIIGKLLYDKGSPNKRFYDCVRSQTYEEGRGGHFDMEARSLLGFTDFNEDRRLELREKFRIPPLEIYPEIEASPEEISPLGEELLRRKEEINLLKEQLRREQENVALFKESYKNTISSLREQFQERERKIIGVREAPLQFDPAQIPTLPTETLIALDSLLALEISRRAPKPARAILKELFDKYQLGPIRYITERGPPPAVDVECPKEVCGQRGRSLGYATGKTPTIAKENAAQKAIEKLKMLGYEA